MASIHPGTAEGAWADDGTIVVSANYTIDNVLRRPLTRLAPDAAFEALTRPGPGESHHDPDILPGSTTVLFTLVTPQTASILAVPLAGGEPRLVLADARRPRYGRSGHLVFQRSSSGDLMLVPFDPDSLATSGEPIRIASAAHVVDSPAFDVARDGTIIYSAPDDTILQADFTAVAVDRTGAEMQIVAHMRSWAEPRVSPDGRTLLLRDIVSPNCDLWTVDLQRGTRTRVRPSPAARSPAPSPWRSRPPGHQEIARYVGQDLAYVVLRDDQIQESRGPACDGPGTPRDTGLPAREWPVAHRAPTRGFAGGQEPAGLNGNNAAFALQSAHPGHEPMATHVKNREL